MNIKTGDIIKFVNKNKRSLNKDFTVHIQHSHKGCQPSVVTKFTEASTEDLTPMSNTVVEKATQYTKFLKVLILKQWYSINVVLVVKSSMLILLKLVRMVN